MIEGRDTSESVASSPQPSSIARWLTVASVLAIGAATLTPSSSPPLESHSHRLCIVCGSEGGVDVILNLVLFLPFGLALGLQNARWPRALAAIAAMTLAIEGLQTFAVPGRDASLGDVLMNLIGGTVGVAAGRRFAMLVSPPASTARALFALWAAFWLAVQGVSAFAMTPQPPSSTYYGQIRPTLGGMSRFDGDVLDARIDSVAIGDGAQSGERSKHLRDLLRNGAATTVAASWRLPSAGVAPIFRIADHQGREVLLVAQASSDVIFSVRTGADVLRLRPIRLRLRQVRRAVAASEWDDTVRIRASYGASHALLTTHAKTQTRELRAALTPSQGWRIFLPMRMYVSDGPGGTIASVAWMFALALPLGFWGAFAVGLGPSSLRRLAALGVAILFTLVGGLVAVPELIAARPAGPADWLSTLAAVFLGAAMPVMARNRRGARFRGGSRSRDAA